MATMEASFPAANEQNDRARKRIPFSARVSIQDIPSNHTVNIYMEDLKMVGRLAEEYRIAKRMSFRLLKGNLLTRNGQDVAMTSVSGERVYFHPMA